ncbi:MAG: hypothetical protein WB290_05340 [Smithella sp.]
MKRARFWMSLQRQPGYTGKLRFGYLTAVAFHQEVNEADDRDGMGRQL